MDETFQKRIHHQGDLTPLLKKVCEDFKLDNYISHTIISIGYEDFNLRLNTENGSFFVKIFSKVRNEKECSRYVDIIKRALDAGVSHPKLYQSNQEFLYETDADKLIVMEYIEGKTFYDLQTTLVDEEIRHIVKQATSINNIDFKPSFIYDHWAITSLFNEYKEKGKYLSEPDDKLIKLLVDQFNSINIHTLPHCFVHGDITKTNTMKSVDGKIYILDFAVSNYYPRIQELAVLLCDLFFDPNKIDAFPKTYTFALSEYQKYIQLTPDEIKLLPTYVKFAHTMHVLLANYEKVVNKNLSMENEYFLNTGRIGLEFTSEIWK